MSLLNHVVLSLLSMLSVLIVAFMLKRKYVRIQDEEKSVLENMKIRPPSFQFKDLGDDLQCNQCEVLWSGFNGPAKNRNSSFRSHLSRHDWSQPHLGIESFEEIMPLEVEDDLQEFKDRINRLDRLSKQQLFYFECYQHHKSHNRNSIKYFNGLFQKIHWDLNLLPMSQLTWHRVKSSTENFFPISTLRPISINGKQLNFLSPITICRRYYASDLAPKLTKWRAPSLDGIKRDLFDGKAWQRIIESGFLDERRNLVFILGADGFSKFRSRSNSTSGIYLVPMNLPPQERSNRKNWSTICCFTELSEVDEEKVLHQVLDLIVDDFLLLDQGIRCFDSDSGEDFLLKARIGLIIADTPEMAALLEKTYPTGIYSCHLCSDPKDIWGKFVPIPKMTLRNHEQVKKDATFIFHLKRDPTINQSTLHSSCQQTGMNGLTPLFRLPYFNYLTSASIDVMHNGIFGISKEVTTEIFQKILRSQTQDSLAAIAKFDKIMQNTQLLPGSTKIRSISNLKDFIADEWLTLIRYGYPALLALPLDLDELSHIERCWETVLIWLKPKISQIQILTLERDFRLFAHAIFRHFGWPASSCSLNWHLPVHYSYLIDLWGPLVYQWCWIIERLNQLSKSIIDSGNHKNVDNWLMQEMTIRSDMRFFLRESFEIESDEECNNDSESDEEIYRDPPI